MYRQASGGQISGRSKRDWACFPAFVEVCNFAPDQTQFISSISSKVKAFSFKTTIQATLLRESRRVSIDLQF